MTTEEQTLVLKRYPEYQGTTPGIILCYGKRICFTIELPWKENRNNISCIPEGTYVLAITYSKRLKHLTPEIITVPGRSGIRIHKANKSTELEGCIAPVSSIIVTDGELLGNMSTQAYDDLLLVIEHYKITHIRIEKYETT